MDGNIECFGIDFGTTNIAVSGLIVDSENNKAFKVPYGEDGVPFPSFLAIKQKEGGGNSFTTLFGRQVKTQTASIQESGYTVIKSIKVSLGSGVTYNVGDRKIGATEAAAGLIQALKSKLLNNKMRKANIKCATVAVPVDFTNAQRSELSKAFESAGIKVNKIISESLAAYIRCRDYVRGLPNVMVFDWGGGTLDISLLRTSGGQVFEESTVGWKVAGDRIDELLAEYVHGQIVQNNPQIKMCYGELPVKDRIKILSECERAKIYFADEEETDRDAAISIVDYCGEKSVRYRLSYDTFCNIIHPVIADAVNLIGEALNKANKNIIELNAIIMVGGSSKLLPLRGIIQTEFYEKYGIKIIYPEKPQWSVAEGAALMDRLNCEYKLNQDIGVVMSDGNLYPIIKKGTGIPFNGASVTFGIVDNATSAHFIFADDKNNILGNITMPAKGFLEEKFTVTGKIGNSLVAEISVAGPGAPGVQNIEINQLSYYCDVSELDKYKFEVM